MPEVAYMDNPNTTTFTPQIANIQKLKNIAMLQDNWDGYGAEPIPPNAIYKALRLIHSLHIQPEIFPTAAGTIQMEYEKDNGDYLEFQLTGNGTCEVFRNTGSSEEYFSSPDNPSSINALVDDFYGFSF